MGIFTRVDKKTHWKQI